MSCIDRLLRYFHGMQAEAGRRLGVARQDIHRWKKRGLIPVEHASKVELVTDSEITRMQILDEHELRARMRRK